MPGTIGAQMPARRACLEKAQIVVVVEEKLGDDARSAGIDLGFEVVEVPRQVGTVGVALRVAGDGDLEIADPLQAANQVGGIGVAAGMGA